MLKSRARVQNRGDLLARVARRRHAVPHRLGDPLRGVSVRRASLQDGDAAFPATAIVACAFGHPARRATDFAALWPVRGLWRQILLAENETSAPLTRCAALESELLTEKKVDIAKQTCSNLCQV